MKKWTKLECDTLMQMVWNQNCDTFLQEIEHAYENVYADWSGNNFPKRSLKACISKVYKLNREQNIL